MKIYAKPTLTLLMLAKEDILNLSVDTENTFWGVADGGMGTGLEIDFDLLRR